MKRLKKISLVYALQASAVVIIFGYPGCSSTIVQSNTKAAQKHIVDISAALVNARPSPDSAFVLKQTAAAQVSSSFLTGK